MAARSNHYNLEVDINAEKIKKDMRDLLKMNDELRKKKYEARSAGDTEGAKRFGMSIEANNRELKKLETSLVSVKKVMSNLSGASLKELKASLKLVNKEMEKTPRNTDKYKNLTNQMKQLKTEIAKVGSESKASTSLISKIGVVANRFQAAVWGLGTAITGLSMTIRKVTDDYAEMEEEMANVSKYTGLSDEAVRELNEEFKKMDTRTPRVELNKLAGDAGRLGLKTKEAVLEFVDGADKINIALGDDLGENAVRDIGKLAHMFGEDNKIGLRGAMLATGSVVNELAQNSSAAADYMVDFTSRLSGVGKQAGLTQQQIMGYGSALNQNNQQLETAATAMSQLLTKMMQNTETFAAMAGKPVKEFAKTLREDANEALLQFLEAMKAKGGFADLAPMFEGMGLNGSRASGILSTLADKLDDVRTAQELANAAYDEGVSVLKETDRMNNTVEAKKEKAIKTFHNLSVELGEKLIPIVNLTVSSSSVLVRVLGAVADVLINNSTVIIGAAASLGVYKMALTATAIWTKACTIASAAWNTVVNAGNTLLKAASVVSLAYKVVINKITGDLTRAAAAQRLLNASMKANVIGAILVAVTALATAIVTLTAKINEANAAAKAMKEINDEVNEGIAAEEAQIKTLVSVINSQTSSEYSKGQALKKLNEMMPAHLSNITEEEVRTGKVNAKLSEYLRLARERLRFDSVKDKIEESIKRQVKLEEERYNNDKLRNDEDFRRVNPMAWSSIPIKNEILDKKIEKEKKLQDALLKGYDERNKPDKNASKKTYGSQVQETTKNISTVKQEVKETTELVKKLKKEIADLRSGKTPSVNTAEAIKAKQKELSEAEEKLDVLTGRKERSKSTSEEEKRNRKEETLRNKREAAFKKETKEHDDQLKAETQKEIAELMERYSKGEILERDYQKQLSDIQEKGLQKRIDYLMTRDIDAANSLKDDLARIKEEGAEKLIKIDVKSNEKQRKAQEIKLKESFYDKNSDMYMNEVALNEALFQNDLEALTKRQGLYKKNSEEWLLLEEDIKNMESQHSLKQKERYFNLLMEMTERYGKADYEIQQKIAEDGLKMLHSKGLISEKEYQEMLLALKAEYASMSVQHTGDRKNLDNALTIANAEGNKAVSGNINQDSIGSTITRWQAATAKLKEIYESDKITYAAYQQGKAELNAQMLEGIVGATQVAYDSINNIMSAASSYAAACSSYEEAMIKKKYQTDIDKAKDGSKKKKKLEEKRDKEIAVAKKKANKKAMNIEIAQALASTAMAAINSYASASKISWVLGPIAAAMATAAGMLQIATIKKQHQAEEAGYYEGGFTGGNKYRREAGVVHEGEFVANHKAVGNSNILPVLNLIDKAQKNNTVGSLTARDISRSVNGANTSLIQVNNIANDEMKDTLARLDDTITLLRTQIEDGITAVASIDGDKGIAKQLKRYNKLMGNK